MLQWQISLPSFSAAACSQKKYKEQKRTNPYINHRKNILILEHTNLHSR